MLKTNWYTFSAVYDHGMMYNVDTMSCKANIWTE